MLLEQVDAVRPQPAQAGLDRLDNATSTARRRIVLVVVQELGGDDGLVAPASQRHPDELLRVPLAEERGDAVLLRGVDEIDAGIKGSVDDAGDLRLIAPRAEEIGAEIVPTETHDRDLERTERIAYHRADPVVRWAAAA